MHSYFSADLQFVLGTKKWCILLAAPTANKITRLRVALRHYILVPNRKTGGKKAFVSLKGSVQPGTCGLEEQF